MKADESRRLEAEIELDSPVSAVWKALVEADELTRWFPPEAGTNPDGTVWMDFGDGMRFTSRVEVFEPERRLRTVALIGAGGDAEEDSVPLATEITLESNSGRTVLRLVHSGFSRDSAWDGFFDATRRGWRFQLGALKHYLERHLGTPRTLAIARHGFDGPSIEEAWRLITGPGGLWVDGLERELNQGDRFVLNGTSGSRFEGRTRIYEPPLEFAGVIENQNDALMRLQIDPAFFPAAPKNVYVWVNFYGVPDADAYSREWTRELARLLNGRE